MFTKHAKIHARLRVFTGELRQKYHDAGKDVHITLPAFDVVGGVSKRTAERIFRKYMHSLLKMTDKTGVDPELLAMAATGLQVNIASVETIHQEPT